MDMYTQNTYTQTHTFELTHPPAHPYPHTHAHAHIHSCPPKTVFLLKCVNIHEIHSTPTTTRLKTVLLYCVSVVYI